MIFASLSGAHLYGFPSPDSDFDLRGIHVLPARLSLGLLPTEETVENSYVEEGKELDIVTHDVRKFFLLMLKHNGYVLEQLYSSLVIHTSPEHQELRAIAPGCITRFHSQHYLGFFRTQWRLFEKSQQAKPLLYAYRVLLTGIHLMQTGRVEANLPILNESFRLSQINDLLAFKATHNEKDFLSESDVEFHRMECHRLTASLEQAQSVSSLPAEPTARKELNDLLVRARLASI